MQLIFIYHLLHDIVRDTINSGSGHVAILQLRIGGVGGGASQWGIFMEETMPQVYTLVDYAVCFVLHWLKNLNNIMTRKYFLLNSCFLLIKFSQLTNAGLKMQIINVFVLKYKKYDDPIQSPIPNPLSDFQSSQFQTRNM